MCGIDLKDIISRYNALMRLCSEHTSLNFDLFLDIRNSDFEINANVVKTKEKVFKLTMTTGVFKSFKNILDYVFENKTEFDFKYYKFEYDSSFLNFYDEDTDKSKYLNKIFGETIDSLIFHELGHCALGHCDEYLVSFSETENGQMPKNFDSQNLEMQADWYGINRTIQTNLYANDLFRNETNFESENFFRLIRREYTSIMISQIILYYSLIEFNPNIKNIDFECMNHAHPYVRIAYLFDSVYEAMFNILHEKTKWEPERITPYLETIFNDSMMDLVYFLNNEKFLNLFELIRKDEIVDVYKVIRSSKHMMKAKSYVPFELKPYN